MSDGLRRAAPTAVGLLLLVAAVGGHAAARARAPGKVALYASVGPILARYDVDVEHAALTKRESIGVPANVQYAWLHPSGRHLYVVWSGGADGSRHGVNAFDVEPGSGSLRAHGPVVPLKYRPIHVTTDRDGAHLLIAYNQPPLVSVHDLAPDGTIGAEIVQTAAGDFGVYLHQVRVEPTTATVFVVGRGNYPEGGRTTTVSGSLRALNFRNGQLSDRGEVASGRGLPFNPRHLDFHPSKPWIFLSVELQNTLQMYRYRADGSFDPAPVFTTDSLTSPRDVRPEYRQLAGAVHVHPDGRFVYQANRGTGTLEVDGKRTWAGGFNSIAVFRINQRTGEPTLVQNADTHGLVARTFSLDPTGQMLVAANSLELQVREGDRLTTVPASLAVFRIRTDRTLDYVTKVDVDTNHGRNSMFWMNIVPVPR